MKKEVTSFLSVEFGSRLRALREENGLTRYMFYDRVFNIADSNDVDESTKRKTVSSWESGTHMPQAQILPRIANVLGCDIDYLYGRIEDKSRTTAFIRDKLGMPETFVETLLKLKNESAGQLNSIYDFTRFEDGISGTDIQLVLLEEIFNNKELMNNIREYFCTKDINRITIDSYALTSNGIPVPDDISADSIQLESDRSNPVLVNGFPIDASYIKQNLMYKIQCALDKANIDLPKEDSTYYDSSENR